MAERGLVRSTEVCHSDDRMTSSFNRIWIKTEGEDVAALLTQTGLSRSSVEAFTGNRQLNMDCLYVDQSLLGSVVFERLFWITIFPHIVL